MTKTSLLTIAFPVLCAAIVHAQTPGTMAKKDSVAAKKSQNIFFKNIRLRRSFETSDQVSEPAQVQVTVPAHQKADWVLDAGLSADIARIDQTTTTNIIVEYHRNTALSAAQNNFQAGYGLNYFGDKATGLNSIITLNLKYVRDFMAAFNSAAITGNYTVFNEDKGLRMNHSGYLNDRMYTYNFGPSVGFEYQYLVAAKDNGNIVRLLGNLSTAIALDKKQTTVEAANSAPKKTLELSLSGTVREAVVNGTSNGEAYTQLYKAGLSYYIVNSKILNASLCASYNYGSNPLAGLTQQSYWQITLQLELSHKR
jgi:hypothetical protein